MHDFTPELLPIRFAPAPDELFSSWLMRLAMAHVTKLHFFSKFLFPEKDLWNRDIDKSANNEHIQAVCARTGLNYDSVFSSTLRSFEGVMYETHNANGNSAWLLPAGVHCRTRKGFGLQMCPLCLAEDKEPYFRKIWRTSWTTVCSRHEIKLLDRCPDCSGSIVFHRSDMGWRNQQVARSMVQCSACSLIWTSKKVIGSLQSAEPDAVDFQVKLENALADEWCEVPEFGSVHSVNFFNGLKPLLRVLSVAHRSLKFRRAVSAKLRMPLAEVVFSGDKINSFDLLTVESRYRTIRLAAGLLNGWSGNFVETALATGTFSSALLPYGETAPFWYGQPVEEYLTRKTHPVSEDEIRSALLFLETKKSFIMPMDLETLLGRKFFEYTSDKFTASIYERIKKFNEIKEKERLAAIRREAGKIANDTDTHSKSTAKRLSHEYRHENSKPPKSFRQIQKLFDSLISKYKCRERLKMVRRMAEANNAVSVGVEFGVSPGIVTKWFKRYEQHGVIGLNDLSRSPKTFRHQTVFKKQEDWIHAIHSEGFGLSEIREQLKVRFDFIISEGGLFRVLNRLCLVLPCSKKHKFIKRNRRMAFAKRRLSQDKIFIAYESCLQQIY